jgi:serine/threonine-protein kinase
MVMEHLTGRDLASALEGGPLSVADAIDYALQTCEAIAEAHALGIVHRDIKPRNLFVTVKPNGKPCVKVLDFGISKFEHDEEASKEVTATRVMLGTPHYMAPEQMRSARRADARADLYSIGAVLYRMLAGQPPFQSDSLTDLTAMVMREAAPRLGEIRREVPDELDRIVARCLEKDPDRRFQSADELAAALTAVRHALFDEPEPASPEPLTAPSAPEAPGKPEGRARSVGVTLAAAVVALALGAAAAVWTTGHESSGEASVASATTRPTEPAPEPQASAEPEPSEPPPAASGAPAASSSAVGSSTAPQPSTTRPRRPSEPHPPLLPSSGPAPSQRPRDFGDRL